jgi:hypothetical protein
MLSLIFVGVLPISVHSVWKIKVPPKIHFFLWLIAQNKLLTRDNLVKRQNVDDLTCLFCNEEESCSHLFCDCVVFSAAWSELKRLNNISVDIHHISDLTNLWNHDKKFRITNMILAALLRGIWLMRNDMCFNRTNWSGMQTLWRKLAFLLAQWGFCFTRKKKENFRW